LLCLYPVSFVCCKNKIGFYSKQNSQDTNITIEHNFTQQDSDDTARDTNPFIPVSFSTPNPVQTRIGRVVKPRDRYTFHNCNSCQGLNLLLFFLFICSEIFSGIFEGVLKLTGINGFVSLAVSSESCCVKLCSIVMFVSCEFCLL
jgi:hypothetical protein